MQTMTKQEEFDDEDDWNPCKAAGVCLMLLATCCEDDIVAHVLPFVKVRACLNAASCLFLLADSHDLTGYLSHYRIT